MRKLKISDIHHLAYALSVRIQESGIAAANKLMPCAYPIPRGGVPAALALQCHMPSLVIVDKPEQADFFIDDLIHSGRTMEVWCDSYPGKSFFALIDKREGGAEDWIVFPWEETAEKGIEDHITRIIEFAGENPQREGLIETPHRVAEALQQWFSGYNADTDEQILKVFKDGAEGYDQMVIVNDIPFYSKCEHHLADIFGTASIAYIPDGKVCGLSKLSRITDKYARRMQVQERLTNQIADAIWDTLSPKGVGVLIKARHMCMESRGICQQGHHTVTSALRGAILDEPQTRDEFLRLAR